MQITTGLRAILSAPTVYDFTQSVMGAGRIRREIADSFLGCNQPIRVLDIGCGTAAIRDYLSSDAIYFGFDISRPYIEHAQRKYRGRGEFFCELLDIKRIQTLPKFDVVLAIGVLHHLDDREARHVMQLANQCLEFGGRLVSIDPCFADKQNPVARFLISRDRGQNVRTQEGYRSIPEGIFSTVQGELRHRAWIPYTHWLMECVK